MAPNQREICEKYLKYTLDYNELSDADVIFECVNENLELKHDIYSRLEKICPNVKSSARSAPRSSPMFWRKRRQSSRTASSSRIRSIRPIWCLLRAVRRRFHGPGVLEFAKEVLESLDRKPVILKKPAPALSATAFSSRLA
jgi:3-hydroxybutyryl-CoA dehydrogenase